MYDNKQIYIVRKIFHVYNIDNNILLYVLSSRFEIVYYTSNEVYLILYFTFEIDIWA